MISNHRAIFRLPANGILQSNNSDDPLPYYYHPLVGFLYRKRIQQALSLLSPPYKAILELGYGSGILIPSLCAIGETVTGIDIESGPEKVKINLMKMNVTASLIRADVSDCYFPDASFDLIVAISILEHIANIEQVISRIHRFLRPKGHCLIGVPLVSNFMTTAFKLIGFHKIELNHINSHIKVLNEMNKYFKLVKIAKLPSCFIFPSLYFNMLFSKNHNP